GEVPATPVSPAPALAISICVVATLFLGVFPGRVLDSGVASGRQLLNDAATPAVAAGAPATLP
ncbi:MAG: hypothetical protein WCF48_09340, partial [Terriglobales bacterium]